MPFRKALIALALLLLAPGSALAQTQAERDRQAILGMTGTFEVTFDMREFMALQPDYKLLKPKITAGEEVVRAIEDKPGKIVLQHILVGVVGKKPMVIKHWRQDWVYEPKTVLVYASSGKWVLQPVAEADRKGAWSQTVWQTDDSPRYGAVGRWTYTDGVTQWLSSETRRPLARRDATRHPPYDHYLGTNRHILTPKGWVQQEDNAKVGTKDGKSITYARESVINSYDRFTDFPFAAADAYWAKTSSYWTKVRAAWDKAIARRSGVAVAEEPELGSVTGERLMDWADEIIDGKAQTNEAVDKAEALIDHTAATVVAAK